MRIVSEMQVRRSAEVRERLGLASWTDVVKRYPVRHDGAVMTSLQDFLPKRVDSVISLS